MNWYAAGAGSTYFGAGSVAVIETDRAGRGEIVSSADAGAVDGVGSNESTRSMLCTLPLPSTSATQLTTRELRDMTNAAAATTHNVPTTTVRGASVDRRFEIRVRRVPDADGFADAPARA